MKARHFLGILIALFIIIGLSLWSNILNIGNSLANTHPSLAILFYSVIIGVVIIFIIIPIIKTILTPEIKATPTIDVHTLHPDELTKYIKKLKLTKDEEREIRLTDNRYTTIENILKNRQSKLNEIVKDAAVDVFLITGISQNGSFDIISSLAINFKLINKIIKQVGFRPTLFQLLKIYTTVIASSLIITSVDDMLGNLDLGSILGSVGKIFLQSAANGAMNALVCLRVGYTTIKYIEVGSKEFKSNQHELSRQARKQARNSLPSILKVGAQKGFNTLSDSMAK